MERDITRKQFLTRMAGLVMLSMITGCGGGGGGTDTSNQEAPPPEQEGLTVEEAAIFDAAPKLPPFDLSTIILADGTNVAQILQSAQSPNNLVRGRRDGKKTQSISALQPNDINTGKTPEEYKRECIANMISKGNELVAPQPHNAEGNNSPAQDKLAYVYGGRTPAIRTKSKGCCPELLYGVDCSGLIYLCATNGKINLTTGIVASSIINPAIWNTAIPAEWKLKMQKVTTTDYQNGDIIGNGRHAGIIVGNSATGISIIQSNGVPGCLKGGGADTDECTNNYSSERGPNIIPLNRLKQYFTGSITVLRLTAASTFNVELTWGAQPDVDLHVYEPDGTHVFYENLNGVSGDLDFDCTTGFGPEHYTTHSDLKDGDYRVGVNYFAGNAPETAKIVITAGTQTQHYSVPLAAANGEAGNDSPIMVATVHVSTDGAGVKTITITAQ